MSRRIWASVLRLKGASCCLPEGYLFWKNRSHAVSTKKGCFTAVAPLSRILGLSPTYDLIVEITWDKPLDMDSVLFVANGGDADGFLADDEWLLDVNVDVAENFQRDRAEYRRGMLANPRKYPLIMPTLHLDEGQRKRDSRLFTHSNGGDSTNMTSPSGTPYGSTRTSLAPGMNC
jgi:hypothetical protein